MCGALHALEEGGWVPLDKKKKKKQKGVVVAAVAVAVVSVVGKIVDS